MMGSENDAYIGILGAVVDQLRRQREPWGKLTANEQAAAIGVIEDKIWEGIRGMALEIAGKGMPVVPMTLDQVQVKVKGGAKIAAGGAITAEQLHALVDRTGMQVVVVLTPLEEYRELAGYAEADEDIEDMFPDGDIEDMFPDGDIRTPVPVDQEQRVPDSSQPEHEQDEE